jgi:hypothetical protein
VCCCSVAVWAAWGCTGGRFRARALADIAPWRRWSRDSRAFHFQLANIEANSFCIHPHHRPFALPPTPRSFSFSSTSIQMSVALPILVRGLPQGRKGTPVRVHAAEPVGVKRNDTTSIAGTVRTESLRKETDVLIPKREPQKRYARRNSEGREFGRHLPATIRLRS